MRLRMAVSSNLTGFGERKERAAATGAMVGARRIGTRAKIVFRQDVMKAGLGPRVANTWQDKVYPTHKESMRPAAHIWSKAPELVSGHTTGATIKSGRGLYLAVASKNVPRRGNRLATPREVLAIFGLEKFNIIKRGANLLLLAPAVRSKNGKTWRRATSFRTGRQSRKAEQVLMFTLVRQVTLRKRLNWPQLADEVGREFVAVLGQEVARAMDAVK